MRIVNEILETTDFLIHSVGEWLGKNPRKHIDPYTIDGDAVVNRDGSLYSVIQLKGYGSLPDSAEFTQVVTFWEQILRPRLSKNSIHELTVCYEADEPGDILDDNFAPAIAQARRMGMDVDDIFEEKKQRYRELCLEEKCWLILYTVPHRLDGPELAEATKEVQGKRKDHPKAHKAQRSTEVARSISDRHREAVSSLANFLESSSYLYYQLSSFEALSVLKEQLLGHQLSQRWGPTVIGQDHSMGEIDILDKNDASFMFPRPLFEQLMDHEPEIVGRNFIGLGDRLFAPVRITQLPSVPVSFDKLVGLLRSANIPYRISFNIKPNGLYTNRWDANAADWTSFASGTNKQIDSVYKGLARYETDSNIPTIAISATACTWAPLESKWLRKAAKKGVIEFDLGLVRRRVQTLINRLNDWGSAQADNMLAYPMKALSATTAGGSRAHYSPVTPAPLDEAVSLLPITRVGLPWQSGTMLWRTSDGSPIPYEQYSALQAYWITLVSGPMGYGKSSQIASQNFSFLVQPADSPNLPILRFIDVGESQKGIVDLVKDSLPDDRKHEAFFLKLQNIKQHSKNPFDTDLMCRHPTSTHKSYLINLICTFCVSMNDWVSLKGLAASVVDLVYKHYDDANFNPNARRYAAGISPLVDRLIKKHFIEAIERQTTWWSIVDALFDVGEFRGATIAQRYAVPRVPDLDAIAQSSDIISEYPDVMNNGMRYVDLFSRSIREVSKLFPCLVSPTQLDISDSPVSVIDVSGVVQRSEEEHIRQQNAIFFLVVFRMLTADFFIDEDLVKEMPVRCQAYHMKRVQYLKACKKRFGADEVHRFSAIPSAFAQFDQMGVEARKFFIDLVLGSQKLSDLPTKLQQLASTIVMCGIAGPGDLKEAVSIVGLNDAAKSALAAIKQPGPQGAEMMVMVDNKQVRRQILHVINTEGPRFLWSSATNAPDRKVRDSLARKLGDTGLARRTLAARFPSGNIRAEQERRQRLLGRDPANDDKIDDILEELVEELYEQAISISSAVDAAAVG